jgi:hypothetical protein
MKSTRLFVPFLNGTSRACVQEAERVHVHRVRVVAAPFGETILARYQPVVIDVVLAPEIMVHRYGERSGKEVERNEHGDDKDREGLPRVSLEPALVALF